MLLVERYSQKREEAATEEPGPADSGTRHLEGLRGGFVSVRGIICFEERGHELWCWDVPSDGVGV